MQDKFYNPYTKTIIKIQIKIAKNNRGILIRNSNSNTIIISSQL